MSKTKTQKYEIDFLLSSKLKEEEVEEATKKIKDKIEDKGEIEREESPKERNLAYSIEDQTVAFLGAFYFKMAPKSFPEFKEEINKMNEIIRFLAVKRKETQKKRRRPKRRYKKKPSQSKKKEKKEDKDDQSDKKVDLDQIEKKLGEIIKDKD